MHHKLGWLVALCDTNEEHVRALARERGIEAIYTDFAAMALEGAEHPLNGNSALADLEIIIALYESAQLQKIELPLEQPHFPLVMMIDEGLVQYP
ncbi:MAG: hypothetical protein ACUVX8_15720 [Candidatus Zipacnadales bacterium]